MAMMILTSRKSRTSDRWCLRMHENRLSIPIVYRGFKPDGTSPSTCQSGSMMMMGSACVKQSCGLQWNLHIVMFFVSFAVVLCLWHVSCQACCRYIQVIMQVHVQSVSNDDGRGQARPGQVNHGIAMTSLHKPCAQMMTSHVITECDTVFDVIMLLGSLAWTVFGRMASTLDIPHMCKHALCVSILQWHPRYAWHWSCD